MALRKVFTDGEHLGAGPKTDSGEVVKGRYVIGWFDEKDEIVTVEFGDEQAEAMVATLQKWLRINKETT